MKPNSIRSVDTNSFEANPLSSRTQASVLSNIGGFNIDTNKDLLKAITGKADTENNGDILQGTLSGSDSLTVTTEMKYDQMDAFLKGCYEKYISDKYKKNFDWIDNIQSIKDAEIIEKLNALLLSNINSVDPQKLWVSIPEILNYSDIAYFRCKSTMQYDDLDIFKLKKEYDSGFSLNNLRSRRIKCFDDADNELLSWSIYRCLYCDMEFNGKQFILNDGKWYQVDQDFVTEVNKAYNETTISNIELPHYKHGQNEKEYNVEACCGKADFCNMDRKLINYGGNKIEFCDIYLKTKKFVHVKKYRGSAVLSHLFAQGLVSAECFFDKEYRRLANKELGKDFHVDEERTINPHEYEIVYAIAKADAMEGELPTIPFFSKVSFRIAKARLVHFGYQVSVIGITKEED